MGEGDASDWFYVVRAGQAIVLKRDAMGYNRPLARLACGSYFGELGLLTNAPRSATIQVAPGAPLATYRFDAQAFHTVIAEHVLLFRMQRQQRRASQRPNGRPFELRSVPFLRELPQRDFELIGAGAMNEEFMPHEVLFWQGDAADRFYVIVGGSVEVDIDGEVVAGLGEGDFFGETALLLDSPRTATVRASAAGVETWSITRRAFQQIVGHYLLRDAGSRQKVFGRMPGPPTLGEAAA